MKTIRVFCAIMLISTSLFSQGISKKEIRRQADSTAFSNLVQLTESMNFKFLAKQALPQSGPTIMLTSDSYSVVLKNDSIICDLPFYGRAFQADPLERGGFHFAATTEDPNVKINVKKKKIEISLSVNVPNDNLKLFFTSTSASNTSLSIISNRKSIISYWGEIEKNEIRKEE